MAISVFCVISVMSVVKWLSMSSHISYQFVCLFILDLFIHKWMLFLVFTYKMPRKRKCYYYMCNNTSDDGMPAFRFPVDDPDRLQKWILNSGNALLKSLPKQLLRNRYICVMHFQPHDFKEGFERCKLIGKGVPMPRW